MSRRKTHRRNERGVAAIVVGISMIVLVTIVGVAVDLGRALYARSILEGAMKSAVTSAAAVALSENPNSPDSAKMTAVAQQRFKDNGGVSGSLYTIVSFDPGYDASTDVLKVTLDYYVPTTFMKLWGYDKLSSHLESSAQRPRAAPTEIALALDVTGSMNDTFDGQHRPVGSTLRSKLDELKTAAVSLINFVMASDYAKVGVVPFTNFVNVGASTRGPWLYILPDEQLTTPDINCTYEYTNCVTNPNDTCHPPDGAASYPCSTTKCDTTKVCTGYRTVTFQGCVLPRGDVVNRVFVPSDNISNPTNPQYVGVVGGSCPIPEMMDLTGNTGKAALISKVNGLPLVSNGNVGLTFQPLGLIWGWNMLDPAAPLTTASNATGTTKPKKSIVLVTDGLNYAYPGSKYGFTGGTSGPQYQAPADALTAQTCQNIQANTDIYIYVVLIADPSASSASAALSRNMLQACTQPRGQFYYVNSAAGLTDAFKQIGKSFTYNSLIN